MGDLLLIIIFIFGVFIMILATIAMAAHYCDNCGGNLVRLTGRRWRCPKCGIHYRIGKLGLGKQEII